MTSSPTHTRADRASTRRGVVRVAAVAAVGGVLAVASGCTSSSGSAADSSASSVPASAVPRPAEPEQLVPGLLNAEVLGVPADWAIRDIDAGALRDEQLARDTDPFLGLLQCPEGTIREADDGLWLARKYTAPEVPLENGLLSIEIIVETEEAPEWEEDRDALGDCTTSAQAEVDVTATRLAVPDAVSTSIPISDPEAEEPAELEATTLQLLASPTADVPYPSAFNATTVNVDGLTVTVVLGGVDMGQSWQHVADDVALVSIDHLQSTRPPN